MRIHITHDTYNIALTKKIVGFFFTYEILQWSPYIWVLGVREHTWTVEA
jgi:hypothetical protein